jgi:hypothetical protein
MATSSRCHRNAVANTSQSRVLNWLKLAELPGLGSVATTSGGPCKRPRGLGNSGDGCRSRCGVAPPDNVNSRTRVSVFGTNKDSLKWFRCARPCSTVSGTASRVSRYIPSHLLARQDPASPTLLSYSAGSVEIKQLCLPTRRRAAPCGVTDKHATQEPHGFSIRRRRRCSGDSSHPGHWLCTRVATQRVGTGAPS